MKTIVKRRTPRFGNFPSIFDDLFLKEDLRSKGYTEPFPSVNIKDEEKVFTLEFALPGYKKEDLSIQVENEMLIISSEKKSEDEATTENYTRKDFSFASFSRSFTLPDIVDLDKIDASTKEGVLFVTLPKKDEVLKNKVKSISIQ